MDFHPPKKMAWRDKGCLFLNRNQTWYFSQLLVSNWCLRILSYYINNDEREHLHYSVKMSKMRKAIKPKDLNFNNCWSFLNNMSVFFSAFFQGFVQGLMTYKVVPLVLQGSEGAAWLPAVWSDTYTWTFQGVLNGWELGCQFTILFSIKQHPLEDAGYAGIVTHPWNLTWIHATKDLSNILNSIATLYVHPWNDMETKNHPFGKEHNLPNSNYCVSMSTFLLVHRPTCSDLQSEQSSCWTGWHSPPVPWCPMLRNAPMDLWWEISTSRTGAVLWVRRQTSAVCFLMVCFI